MTDTHDKGAFRAEIPLDAVEDALRSVERIARGEPDPAVPLEVDGEAAAAGGALPRGRVAPGAARASRRRRGAR